jgi:aspartate beta-hydroxylase
VAIAASREEVERRLASGDIAGALSSSDALLEAQPRDTDALTLRAAALMAAGRPTEAVDVLAPQASGAGADPALQSALAMCQVAASDRSAAIRTFETLLVQSPEDFTSRLAYAECLERQVDAAAALPEYFRAVHVAQRYGRWLNDATTIPALRARVKRAMDLIDAGRQDLFERVFQPHLDSFGRDAMARVAEALHVYLGTQRPPARDPRQQPKFFWMPGLLPKPFYPRQPWCDTLEAAAPDICEELGGVLDAERELVPFLVIDDRNAEEDYLGGDPRSRAWDAFFFYRHGQRHAARHAACPRTSTALESVPLTRIAGHAPEVLFSVLAPQTHIKPHHGVTNTRVVTHLPLLIPQGDCKLVVGGVGHVWDPGRCVTFDDTFLHEAWNRTDHRRVVLILDTWNPDLAPEECVALKDLVERIGDFNARAGIS